MPKEGLDGALTTTWYFHYLCVLLTENCKIKAVCFFSFHNGCHPAYKVWRRLRTEEWDFSWITNWYMSYTVLYLTKFVECISFFGNNCPVVVDWNYLLLLLLSEWTVLIIAGEEICVQRTLMNSILLILCFCFVLHCSSF